ncbi:hypothetical protein JNM05_06310 [bacterium]|nr:hypothetical protein [bacterium]
MNICHHIGCLAFLLIFMSCESESNSRTNNDHLTPPDDTLSTYSPSNEGKLHFLLDATDFAVDHLFAKADPDTAMIRIPDTILNKYLYPLAALYDSRDSIPLLDTLIIMKNIHNKVSSNYGLALNVDTLQEWVHNLKIGTFPTGNTTVDSLTTTFSLNFSPPSLWDFHGYPWFFVSHPPLNVRALANAFAKVPGVVYAGPNHYYNFSTKLEMHLSTEADSINMYYGYGNCIGGCSGYERWIFIVYKNRRVVYAGYKRE